MSWTTSAPRRRGVVLALVLVCVLVSSVIAATVVRTTMLGRGQLESEVRAAQADLLAEAGIELGLRRWKGNPDYAGEVWKPAGQSAEVRLELMPVDEAVLLRVVADVQPPGRKRVRASRSVQLK